MSDVAALIETLKERQRALWEQALPHYMKAVSCQLGLCGEAKAIEDSIAAESRPDEKQRLQVKLQSLQHAQQRGWQKLETEVRQLEVAIEVLQRKARGELGL